MQSYEEALAEHVRLGLMKPNGQPTNRCQCRTCGEVFSVVRNFDLHLSPGRNRDGYDGPWCRPPAEVGLVQHERGWWQLPGPDVKFEREAS